MTYLLYITSDYFSPLNIFFLFLFSFFKKSSLTSPSQPFTVLDIISCSISFNFLISIQWFCETNIKCYNVNSCLLYSGKMYKNHQFSVKRSEFFASSTLYTVSLEIFFVSNNYLQCYTNILKNTIKNTTCFRWIFNENSRCFSRSPPNTQ